ncbi:10678_t:CDS:2 [Dentiscutata erythropus]|uniref:10678_t:CDS:1 n=1 Tax=Dentiscutata erythropus TaxID=1348616 RepID=A0A9N9HYX8_9GLOM|nr:10678_t:CDS:2 [Dentiscutata erythropus]
MNQQGQNGTSEIKDLGVTPTLPHLVDFGDKCATIKKLSTEILQKAERDAAKKPNLVGSSSLISDPSIQSAKQQLARSFIQLRGLNRTAMLEKSSDKLTTQDAKLSMDRIHLQLQDLNYMKTFLQREIRRCKSFRSKYQKVPLISEEEFLSRAPTRLTAPLSDTEASEKQQLHHRMLQRLNFEKEERIRYFSLERLKEEVTEKLKRKKEASERVMAKKAKIDQFNKEFEKFIKQAKPLNEILADEEAGQPDQSDQMDTTV